MGDDIREFTLAKMSIHTSYRAWQITTRPISYKGIYKGLCFLFTLNNRPDVKPPFYHAV